MDEERKKKTKLMKDRDKNKLFFESIKKWGYDSKGDFYIERYLAAPPVGHYWRFLKKEMKYRLKNQQRLVERVRLLRRLERNDGLRWSQVNIYETQTKSSEQKKIKKRYERTKKMMAAGRNLEIIYI